MIKAEQVRKAIESSFKTADPRMSEGFKNIVCAVEELIRVRLAWSRSNSVAEFEINFGAKDVAEWSCDMAFKLASPEAKDLIRREAALWMDEGCQLEEWGRTKYDELYAGYHAFFAFKFWTPYIRRELEDNGYRCAVNSQGLFSVWL